MKKSKKFFGKKKGTKNKKKATEERIVNKKSIFNRYKNAQKIEEELEKNKKMEEKLKQQNMTYSESEEEEDAYNQLLSCFSKNKKRSADSDESSGSEVDDEEVEMSRGESSKRLNASNQGSINGEDSDNGDEYTEVTHLSIYNMIYLGK